jgi:hypothetical protein
MAEEREIAKLSSATISSGTKDGITGGEIGPDGVKEFVMAKYKGGDGKPYDPDAIKKANHDAFISNLNPEARKKYMNTVEMLTGKRQE